MKLKHINLPWAAFVLNAFHDAASDGSVLALVGPTGSGTSTLLCQHRDSLLPSRSARVVQLSSQSDPIMVVRTATESLQPGAVPANWRQHSLSMAIELLATTIQTNQVRCVMFDRAGHAGAQSITELLAAHDRLTQARYACGFVFAGDFSLSKITHELGGFSSPFSRTISIPELEWTDVVGALAAWFPDVEQIKDLVTRCATDPNDPETKAVLRLLSTRFGSCIRSLSKFATIWATEFNCARITRELVSEIVGVLLGPSATSDPRQFELALKS